VIEPEEMENGGVEVVNVDWVLRNPVSNFIALAVGRAGLYSAASQEAGEGLGVVIAAIRVGVLPGCAAKLGATNDESLLQHSALLEILDQSGHGAIKIGCQPAVVLHVPMAVPVAVIARKFLAITGTQSFRIWSEPGAEACHILLP
jgi:hypothetical protein